MPFSPSHLLIPSLLLMASIAILLPNAVDAKSVVVNLNATVTVEDGSGSSEQGGGHPQLPGAGGLDLGHKMALALVAPNGPHAEQLACQANRLVEFAKEHGGMPGLNAGMAAVKIQVDCFQGGVDNSECCAAEGMDDYCLPLCNGRQETESNLTGVFKDPQAIGACVFNNPQIIGKCVLNNTLMQGRMAKQFKLVTDIYMAEQRKLVLADEGGCEIAKEGCNLGCEGTCQIIALAACELAGPLYGACVGVSIPTCVLTCLSGCGSVC